MGGGANLLLVTLPFGLPENALDPIRKEFPHLEIKVVSVQISPTYEHIGEKIPQELWQQVSVLVTFTTLPPDPKNDAPNLQYVHLSSAGSNTIVNSALYKDTDITITTSTGIHGPQIAEWLVMTRLAAAHHLRPLYELQGKHDWYKFGKEKNVLFDGIRTVRDQPGKRIGILGYGSIGRQVGRLAKALGMEVLAFTATPKDTAEKRRDDGYIVPGTGDAEGQYPDAWYHGLDKADLHHFLAQKLDWLVITLPLTKETTHMLGSEEFKVLGADGRKPYLSNIARGPIVVTADLIAALKDGTLGGAALDVTDPEPLPADSELWDIPNVTITPHVSGITTEYFNRSFDVLRVNLHRRDHGEKLLNIVDRKRGY